MSSEALVIAITRLGDIIQTEPMVRALKAQAKVDKVTVLVERSFAEVASRISCADEVKCIDFEPLLGQLDRTHGSIPLREYLELSEWLQDSRFETVYNVTHSRPSMMLAALAGHSAQGVTLNRAGMQVVNNRWLQYFFATNLARPWCSFNLVDVYVNAVNPQIPQVARKLSMKSASKRRKKSVTLRNAEVLLHVGASKSDKQWPLEKFVALSKTLLSRGANVTLMGGVKSETTSRAFPEHKNFRNLLGMTSVADLFDLCHNANLLISADSGPVHVAAACDLPIVVIEGGSAHGFETAPYCAGSIVIQPHLENLMTRIPGKHVTSAAADLVSVDTVMSAIEYLAEERDNIAVSPQCTSYEAFYGDVVPGLELRAISGSNAEYEEWQRQLRRFWWRIGSGGHSLCGDDESRLASCAVAAANAAGEIAKSDNDFEVLSQLSAKLSAAEQSLTKFIGKYPPLHHLNYFLQIARSSVQGESAQEQAEELEQLYDDVADAAQELSLPRSRQPILKHSNSNSEKERA